MKRIETIAIGDELLTGRIADTNSAWVARSLFERGFSLAHSQCIPDDPNEIRSAVTEAARRSDAVLVFGGLGPTSDDKTAAAVAELLGGRLVEHAPSKERLLRFLQERGRTPNETVLKQVVYPEKAEPMLNQTGLATGFHCRIERARCFFFPGVPHEMKAMFEGEARATLFSGSPDLVSHTWRCLSLPESELQRLMNPIEARLPNGVYLGYRTRFPENHLTLYVRGGSVQELDRWKPEIAALLAPHCYTERDLEPEHLVLEALKEKGQSLVAIESCTGGTIAQRLTAVPGASECFWGGYVAYDTRAKDSMLGVKVEDPQAAVSAQTSRRLAEAALERSPSGPSLAVAITGYLGPGGGTLEHPVGTLFVCVAQRNGARKEKRFFQPHRDRERSQWGAATSALCLVHAHLTGK